jgi:cell division protein FtsW (lipid II flippase)
MAKKAAAWAFVALLIPVICLQFGLAAGMPWGELAMGGQFPGQFPTSMRIAALLQIALLLFVAAVILARAGVALEALFPLSRRLIWIVVALLVVAVVLNLITPSVKERDLWLPVATGLLLCAVVVAFSGRSSQRSKQSSLPGK